MSSLQAKSRSEKHAKRNDFVRTKLAEENVTTGFSPIFDPRYVVCHCGQSSGMIVVERCPLPSLALKPDP